MNESIQELAVHVAGRGALVAGDPGLVQSFLQNIGVVATDTSRVGQGTADLAAVAAGLAAVSTSLDGTWVQLTSDSHTRLMELFKHNLPANGVFSGVIRGEMGRIDSFLQFTPGGLNPVAMTNIANLTAIMALRKSIAQLETLVQSMDIKLDQLLQDNRAKALGDINGLTQVLTRAVNLYDETGRVTETAWSQIAGHATALAQASSHALAQIEAMTKSISPDSFAKQVNAVETLADSELRSWLIILAVAQANQLRLETLELAHLAVHSPEAVPAHAAAIESTAELRRLTASRQLQSLLDAISSTADVSDFNRLRNPFKSRAMLNSAESAMELIRIFGEVYGLQNLTLDEVERESWRKSFSDLTKSTTNAVTSAVKSVPVGIARVGGDVIVKAATQIEAKRGPEDSTESGPDQFTSSEQK